MPLADDLLRVRVLFLTALIAGVLCSDSFGQARDAEAIERQKSRVEALLQNDKLQEALQLAHEIAKSEENLYRSNDLRAAIGFDQYAALASHSQNPHEAVEAMQHAAEITSRVP